MFIKNFVALLLYMALSTLPLVGNAQSEDSVAFCPWSQSINITQPNSSRGVCYGIICVWLQTIASISGILPLGRPTPPLDREALGNLVGPNNFWVNSSLEQEMIVFPQIEKIRERGLSYHRIADDRWNSDGSKHHPLLDPDILVELRENGLNKYSPLTFFDVVGFLDYEGVYLHQLSFDTGLSANELREIHPIIRTAFPEPDYPLGIITPEFIENRFVEGAELGLLLYSIVHGPGQYGGLIPNVTKLVDLLLTKDGFHRIFLHTTDDDVVSADHAVGAIVDKERKYWQFFDPNEGIATWKNEETYEKDLGDILRDYPGASVYEVITYL